MQMHSKGFLHGIVRTVSAKIEDVDGPGVGKFTFANEFNSALHKNVRNVSAKIKDFNGPGVGKLTFASEFK